MFKIGTVSNNKKFLIPNCKNRACSRLHELGGQAGRVCAEIARPAAFPTGPLRTRGARTAPDVMLTVVGAHLIGAWQPLLGRWGRLVALLTRPRAVLRHETRVLRSNAAVELVRPPMTLFVIRQVGASVGVNFVFLLVLVDSGVTDTRLFPIRVPGHEIDADARLQSFAVG